jgi:hypothetical protein
VPVQFEADAWEDEENQMFPPPTFTWHVNRKGSISPDGVFSARKSGWYVVSVEAGGAVAYAQVRVIGQKKPWYRRIFGL